VFPTAIRDLVATTFAGQVEPMLRVWKAHRDQVRFDDPLPVDVEAAAGAEAARFEALARAIEAEVRGQLQVRVAVTVLANGTLPKSAYKNSLLAVREPPHPDSLPQAGEGVRNRRDT
jgi:hypothetical protein